MLTSSRLKRRFALLLFAFLSVLRAEARLDLTADVSVACPGEAIVLTLANSEPGAKVYYSYMVSSDKKDWKLIQSQTMAKKATADMLEDANSAYFKVMVEDTKAESNIVEVKKNTSKDCGKSCHQTSTGEFFNGTDFDPYDEHNTRPTIPKEIVSFFEDGEATVRFESTHSDNYHVTSDIAGYFGNGIAPSMRDYSTNYYYTYDSFKGNDSPFKYVFPYRQWHDKNYTFLMRFYVLVEGNCDVANAQLKLETGSGNYGSQQCNVKVYLDKNNQLISDKTTTVPSFGSAKLDINGHSGELLRVDATFYGKFPHTGQSIENSVWNNDADFDMVPLFQQIGNCTKIAVDYISAEIESVCLTKGTVCKGEWTTINAAGFPVGTVYTWEHEVAPGIWEKIYHEGTDAKPWTESRLDLLVDFIGKENYRVSGPSTSGDLIVVNFTVSGKDCDPTAIEEIKGADRLCTPHSETMTVAPVDANDDIHYRWSLVDPNGKEIKDKTVIYQDINNTRGTSIELRLPKGSVEGEYTLSVQMIKVSSEPDVPEVAVGEVQTKKIMVYNSPDAHFKIDGFVGNGKDSICASDLHQKIYATDNTKLNPAHDYVYSWVNGSTPLGANSPIAEVTWTDKDHDLMCEGLKSSHYIKEIVAIKLTEDLSICPAEWDTTLSVKKPKDPIIECDKFNKVTVIYLGPKDSVATIKLPVPVVSGTCDNHPTVTIEGKGLDIKDRDLYFKIVADLKDLEDGKVKDMIRDLYITAGKEPDNRGLVVTYSLKDGCGKASNTCEIKFIVRDTVAADIPCSEIKDFTTNLSYYKDMPDPCFAYPGEGLYPDKLPVLKNPVLKDQNGVDGVIVGVLVGRLDNQSSAAKPLEPSEAWFAAQGSKELNKPFPAGYSHILWKFTDRAGNVSYCVQVITVIDDKEPAIDCPVSVMTEVSVQKDTEECGLSTDSLLATLGVNGVPTAREMCPVVTEIEKPKLYYRELPNGTWIEITDYKALIFAVDKKYEVQWRFYKTNTGTTVDKSIYAECVRQFSIVDNVAPVPPCDLINDTIVTVNYNIKNNTDGDYASGADVVNQGDIVYTLRGFFKTPPSATDACEGSIEPSIIVVLPASKDNPRGKTIEISKPGDLASVVVGKLNLVQFPEGSSNVIYTYTDSKGNSSQCIQNIIVYKRMSLNCGGDIEVAADADCKGYFDISPSTVPTAVVAYVRQIANKKTYAMNQPYEAVDCDAKNSNTESSGDPLWGADKKKPCFADFFNAPNSGSETESVLVDVYPFKVKKVSNVETSGAPTKDSKVTVVENTSELSKEPWKVVNHYLVPAGIREQVFKTLDLKTKTFTKEFSEDFKTLEKGTHKFIWFFDNGHEANSIDSCEVLVTVVDTTPPTVTCGDWEKTITAASDPVSCTAKINIDEPNAEDLKAKDNCTEPGDLDITFERVFEGAKSTSLTAPFQQGTTTITWIITDEAGKSSYCVQKVVVKDTTPPKVTCSDILISPLNVFADGDCEVKKDAMHLAGLETPKLPLDAELCSPVKGGIIKGEGVRVDQNGKPDGLDPLNDPYPLGTTIIVWTFKDSLNNKEYCRQIINVADTLSPKFDCEQLEKNPVTFELAPDICSASHDEILAKLGKHNAADNCSDDSIPGVPYWNNNGVRVDIPKYFEKNKTYDIEWVFTDDAKNEKVCHQKFTVKDTTPPIVTICPDPEKTIQAKVTCTLSFDDLELPELKITDECDGEIVGILSGVVQQPNGKIVYPSTVEECKALSYYAGSVNHFTWTFRDDAGNESKCELDLTIADSIAPQIMNCTTDTTPVFNMSEGVCYAKWDDISKLFVMPIAYDECQELLTGSGPAPLDPLEIRRYHQDTLVVISRDGDEAWKADPFERGEHRFVWVFTDDAGNIDSCAKTIKIVLRTNPTFICDSIQPNPLRPKAEPGECSVAYKDLVLGKYWGFHACTEDSIPAVPLMSATANGLPFPDTLQFIVGDSMHIYWVVIDDDRNIAVCPQTVIPSHSNPVDFDCKTLTTIEETAFLDECYIPAEKLGIKTPFAIDSCALANGVEKDTVWGVPSRSDSLDLLDIYPTGTTTITWTFVSPYNIDDTLRCDQDVFIKGNKHFDFDCDVILPAVNDTVSDCGPDNDIKLVAPVVPDPCLEDSVTGKVFARTDGEEESAPFQLGTTIVTWTFTEGTGTITDTCRQTITVLTDKPLKTPCKDSAMKTIEVPAPDDACTVPVADVQLGKPFALHPCTNDTVWGVLSRPGITDLNTPFIIGLNRLVWTFTDTTGTLVEPEAICEQFVKVGSVEVEPVDCKNIPAVNKILAEDNCTIDFADFKLDIPVVIDRCPNGDPNAEPDTILPTITRFTDNVWVGHKLEDIKPFGVGRDTLYWNYVIAGIEYNCKQPISIKDSVAPKFDCSKLMPVIADSEEDECEVDSSVVLKLLRPFPAAIENCTKDSIEGVPSIDGKPLPESFKVGETYVVTWTFQDTIVNVKAHTCEQTITVMGNNEPKFNCDSLKKDTLKYIAEGGCSYVMDVDKLPIPIAKDFCNDSLVPGVPSRADGEEVYGKYYTGFTTITWTFKSPYSNVPATCEQVIWVVSDLDLDGMCGKENYPDINEPVSDGICQVPSDKINKNLGTHSIPNPCHNTWMIQGVPSRSDGKGMDEDYPVGLTTITWTFTDTTNTLLNPTTTCKQSVIVGDNNQPPVDCETVFPDAKLYLDADNCSADNSMIPNNLEEMPVNACNGDVATLDITRESGKAWDAPFEVGKDVVIYTFEFPSNQQTHICRQNIEVLDTIAPDFDCNTLAPVIIVPLTTGGSDSVSYEQIVEMGFKVPVVTDKCCEVKTEVKRNDGKDYQNDKYPLGETKVTFIFSDDHDNSTICEQIIKVTDMVPPELNCPKFGGSYNCLTDIPNVLNYKEFVAAGGGVDDPSRTDFDSFRAEDVIDGDSCEAKVIRTYFISSVRGDEVSCHNNPDTFLIKDDVAPTFEIDGVAFNGSEIEVDCHGFEGMDAPVVKAVDNCDPNPQIKMTKTSTQGTDPGLCSYYQFDIIYTWTAIDRCDNAATPVSYTIHVLNDKKPVVHEPIDWEDDYHPLYLKNCTFGVPDITELIPIDSVRLNCGDTRDLVFTQNPEFGTIIDTSVLKYDPVKKFYVLPVELFITDVCGNFEKLVKNIVVQPRAQIINVLVGDGLVCADETALNDPRSPSVTNSLSSSEIRSVSGSIWNQDFDGTWVTQTPPAVIEVFRGEISESAVVFSENMGSYGSRFADAFEDSKAGDAAYAKYNLLLRRNQSDTYYFIALDTVSGCSDTNSVYVDVRERPRITLDTKDWDLCDGDSIALQGDFKEANPVCVEDMGTPVTAEGWMLNNEVYKPKSPVNYNDGAKQTALYYATNECGTTLSNNSLFTLCDEGAPVNHEDSLKVFGSEENLKLAQADELYAHDSVVVVVATHFDAGQVLLTTNPHIKPRVWEGETAQLVATLPYDEPQVFMWKKVVGEFDGEQGALFDRFGNVVVGGSGENDDIVLEEVYDKDSISYKNRFTIQPSDTSYYYVVVGNGVCPSVSSNIVNIDVNYLLPTAFTPFSLDGFNDHFMKGYEVKIFNRYGQLLYEGNDGWDGYYRGLPADPGVYFYEIVMKNGKLRKGSIEVVKVK